MQWGMGALAVGVAVTTAFTSLLGGQIVAGPQGLVMTSSVAASAALVVSLVLLTLVNRVVEGLQTTTVVLSALTAITLFHLAVVLGTEGDAFPAWGSAVELLLLATTVAVLELGSAGPRLIVALSAGTNLVAVTLLTVAVTSVHTQSGTTAVDAGLAVGFACTFGIAAAVVHRDWPRHDATRVGAVLALVVMGASHAARTTELDGWVGVAIAEAEILAPCLLGCMVFVLVQGILEAQASRSSTLRERLLVEEETARRQQVDDHAMRNMVAGISMASELLDDHELDYSIRRRLERTIQTEVEQLRLLLDQHATIGKFPPHRPPARQQASETALSSTGVVIGESYVNQSQ